MVTIVFSLYQMLWFFVIYSFFGWCLEVVYQAVEHGVFINRGFLNGPYCPIYGFGVITVIIMLYPLRNNILVLYAGSVLLTTAIELVTGFFLEKIFHQHWWDYSDQHFNFKGYICLKFSLLWGVACLITIKLIQPSVDAFVDKLPEKPGIILLSVFYIGFASDFIITVTAIMNIKKRIMLLEDISGEMRKISDATGERIFDTVEEIRDKRDELSQKNAEYRKRMEELRERYRSEWEKRGYSMKRIQNAFPKLKLVNSENFRQQLDELRSRVNNIKSEKRH